jgi:hypothetical protein
MEQIMETTTLLIAAYLFPTIVALLNSGCTVSDKLATFVLNVMCGWTIIGWIVVYCFASSNHKGAARLRRAKANFYLREDAKFNSN